MNYILYFVLFGWSLASISYNGSISITLNSTNFYYMFSYYNESSAYINLNYNLTSNNYVALCAIPNWPVNTYATAGISNCSSQYGAICNSSNCILNYNNLFTISGPFAVVLIGSPSTTVGNFSLQIISNDTIVASALAIMVGAEATAVNYGLSAGLITSALIAEYSIVWNIVLGYVLGQVVNICENINNNYTLASQQLTSCNSQVTALQNVTVPTNSLEIANIVVMISMFLIILGFVIYVIYKTRQMERRGPIEMK